MTKWKYSFLYWAFFFNKPLVRCILGPCFLSNIFLAAVYYFCSLVPVNTWLWHAICRYFGIRPSNTLCHHHHLCHQHQHQHQHHNCCNQTSSPDISHFLSFSSFFVHTKDFGPASPSFTHPLSFTCYPLSFILYIPEPHCWINSSFVCCSIKW